jgi:probable HAF family extracellular repeat protein
LFVLRDSGVSDLTGHGFVHSEGGFAGFDLPAATVTQADAINDDGQIVGAYLDANGAIHGFLKVDQSYPTLDFPGAAVTSAWGINNKGQIVGIHRDAVGGVPQGFIARPSEPE